MHRVLMILVGTIGLLLNEASFATPIQNGNFASFAGWVGYGADPDYINGTAEYYYSAPNDPNDPNDPYDADFFTNYGDNFELGLNGSATISTDSDTNDGDPSNNQDVFLEEVGLYQFFEMPEITGVTATLTLSMDFEWDIDPLYDLFAIFIVDKEPGSPTEGFTFTLITSSDWAWLYSNSGFTIPDNVSTGSTSDWTYDVTALAGHDVQFEVVVGRYAYDFYERSSVSIGNIKFVTTSQNENPVPVVPTALLILVGLPLALRRGARGKDLTA